jgi:NAD-dependent SIR2 family protein deacetylase
MAKELKLAIFLGAGASVPYGKPTTRRLKNQLLNKYEYTDVAESSQDQYYLYSIINFSKFEDIEHILQCVKEIDDFFSNSQYGGKYLLEREYKLHFEDPRRPWELSTLTSRTKSIMEKLEDDVFENYSWNHSADQTLVSIFNELFNFIKKYSKEIHVFTTNYDRAVEEYCSNKDRRCRCMDGFQLDEYSNRRLWSGKYAYPSVEGITNVYLYKLHGSLNWRKHKVYGVEATGEERRSRDPNYVENLLVYPTLSPKNGTEIEPYRTIRNEFKKFMEVADVCIIVGFSFRDEHINSIFSDFIKRGKSIIVISPSADKNVYTNLLRKDMPQAERTIAHNTDESIACLFRENKKIITINQPLSLENSTKINNVISTAVNVLFPNV